MKIFNWVHRKFNHKDECGRNLKKDECIVKDNDTKSLLENVDLADLIDGWKGGLLTIGTLGFDPMQKFFDLHEDYHQFSDENGEEESEDDVDDDDDDEYLENDEYSWINDEQESELDPLVCTTFKHNLDESNENDHIFAAKVDMIMNINGKPLSATNEIIDFDSEKGKKRERITLADLFSADKDNEGRKAKDPPINGGQEWMVNATKVKPATATQAARNGLSFAKKLIPRVGDDSRPIHKLNRMMTRMLKRKIHPELDQWKTKKTSQTKHSKLGLISNNKHGDSISLLQTQENEI